LPRRRPPPMPRHRPPPRRTHPPQHPIDHRLHIPPRHPPPPPRPPQRLLPRPIRRHPPPPRQILIQHPRHILRQRHIPRPPTLTDDPPAPHPVIDVEILHIRPHQLRHPRPHRHQPQHDPRIPQLPPLITTPPHPPRRTRHRPTPGQTSRRIDQPLGLLPGQRPPLRRQPTPLPRRHRRSRHRIDLHPPRQHRMLEERRHRP